MMTGSVTSRSNAVELKYVPALVSEASDDVEFAAGWGQTGIVGKSGTSFEGRISPRSSCRPAYESC